MATDVIVIGAGTVGAAIAYGLVGCGLRVTLLDGDDSGFRAARANFGLVWQQGKGHGMPAYQRATRESVNLWSDFETELSAVSGVDMHYEQNGGLVLCAGDAEMEKRRTSLSKLDADLRINRPDWEMLDRAELAKLFPKARLGDGITGASLGHRDGQANPLFLLAALHAGVVRRSGQLRAGCSVSRIVTEPGGGFTVETDTDRISASKVVISAGLGSKALAEQVGMDIPLRPQRGQILVTERVQPIFPLPMSGLRQTREGTIMIGATNEDVGHDVSVTAEAAAKLSRRALMRFPALQAVKLVRQWGGLRVLTPDEHPIYAESETSPGAFVAICHSGVTLAALHARALADDIAAGGLSSFFDEFHQRRFDVPQAA